MKTTQWKHEAQSILDIGCGSNPEGTTNLDLYTGTTPHHKYIIDPEQIKGFHQGNAENLPFMDNSFDLAIMSHVLEHTINPDKALQEAARVAPRLILRVPNNPVQREHKEHLYTWSITSLNNLLHRHFSKVEIKPTTRPEYIADSRFFKYIGSIPILGQVLSRFIANLFQLELVVYCEK